MKDNDIYLRPSPSASVEYQITKTGIPGVIYNGVPDWVYEGTYGFISNLSHE